jgi:hypothetical protein
VTAWAPEKKSGGGTGRYEPDPTPRLPDLLAESFKDRNRVETCQRRREGEGERVRKAFVALPPDETGARYTLNAEPGMPIMGQMIYANRARTPINTGLGTQP